MVAAEPAAGLRSHGASQRDEGISWVDDRFPSLARLRRLSLSFDLIILSAVWQHVAPGDRSRAFRKLIALLRPGGVLALTLRSGPAPSDRPMHPTSVGEILSLAGSQGMDVLRVQPSNDLQGRADIKWTMLVLRRPERSAVAIVE